MVLADGHHALILAELVLGAPTAFLADSRSPVFNDIQSNSTIFTHSGKKFALVDGPLGGTVRATRCELGQLALRNQGKSD